MDVVLLLLGGAVLVVLTALFFVSKWQSNKAVKEEKTEGDDDRGEEDTAGAGQRGPRTAQQRMRQAAALRARRVLNQRRGGPAANEGEEQQLVMDEGSPEDIRDMLDREFENASMGKLGAKKVLKLERKAEKAAMREQDEQRRKEKKEREEQRDADRRQKEEEEQLEEERLAKEEEKRKEEQERREQEEYERLKASFAVEESGEDAVNEDESQSLLQEFIAFIKEKKVVMLEDLAAHFNLKTQDAISRLKDLLATKEIQGLLDDRGKFIYITEAEYEAVAKFIVQRGRVSIAELAQECTQLLHLPQE